MVDVMVDLETLGSTADAPIISIGAVVIKDLGIASNFYVAIDLKDSLKYGNISADTLKWWMKQSDASRFAAFAGDVSLPDALIRFASWLQPLGGDVRVWGNGASFDNAILALAYKKLEIQLPWKFWNDRCFRTIKNTFVVEAPPRRGEHHNALDDAISQAEHLIEIMKVYNL